MTAEIIFPDNSSLSESALALSIWFDLHFHIGLNTKPKFKYTSFLATLIHQNVGYVLEVIIKLYVQ